MLTDYPDPDLVDNLRHNAVVNSQSCGAEVRVDGYLWGNKDVSEALSPSNGGKEGFDVLLLADLNFNHSCHEALAETICMTMKQSLEARALVFFTPYRPWLLEKDLAFFDVCKGKGMYVRKILEKKLDTVMFEGDRGDEALRRTVFGYEVRWNNMTLDDRHKDLATS